MVEVLVHCTDAARGDVADVEMHAVRLLVGDRHDRVHDERPLDLRRNEPWHQVDAFEHDRPALGQRTTDRSIDADADMPRLLDEPGDGRVALHLADHRLAGREARAMDRRHELLGEERAHRLADEVGRRHAGDAQPVRNLGRDRRLAGAGRAADQHDQRHIERLEVGEPPQPLDGALAVIVAEVSRASSSRRARSTVRSRRSARSTSMPPREAVGAICRDSDGDQRSRHHPLRIRKLRIAERQRIAVSPLVHGAPIRDGYEIEQRRIEVAPSATTSFAARTTRRSCASACSATTSIAAAFTSTRYVSASTPARSRAVPRDRRGWSTRPRRRLRGAETSVAAGREHRDAARHAAPPAAAVA